jgi:hypothetical protein
MAEKITVKLENGTVISGTSADIAAILEKVGGKRVGGFYHSSSKGLIPISTMHTNHIMNALRKIYRNWVNDLSRVTEPDDLLKMLREGPKDGELLDLIGELVKRSLDT